MNELQEKAIELMLRLSDEQLELILWAVFQERSLQAG
jgi:hypothetical protein